MHQEQQHQQQQLQQQWQQSTAIQPANVPYFIVTVPAQTTIYPSFPQRKALGLGITLIVAGSLSIIFNIASLAISTYTGFGFPGHGIWTGTLSIIAGSLGIGAGLKKTKCSICAFNVMCIIAASSTAAQFSLGVTGAVISGSHVSDYCSYYYYYCKRYGEDAQLVMTILLALHAVIEAVAAIWGSVICCKTSCCCSSCEKNPRPAVMQSNGLPLQMLSGIQPLPPMQSAVMVQGYNGPYQPGYPGQPQAIQFINAPPPALYQVQGQLMPSGQLPPYNVAPTNFNVMYMDQQLTVPAQPPVATGSKAAEGAASQPFPPPDYHQ